MEDTPHPPSSEKRRAKRGRRWKIGRLIAIVSLLLLFVLPCAPFLWIPVDVYNSHRERERLLHETDHHALLAASRKLMRDHAGEEIAEPDQDPRVPRIIRELGPSYMSISTDQLRVELHGGFDHYGFIAFSDGVDWGDGGVRLIDGLYYYTE
jgi:hypothetical protein